MGKSEFDPAGNRPAWNAGRKVGAKRALKPRQVWAIRFFLDQHRRMRDRALFDLGDRQQASWLRRGESQDRRSRAGRPGSHPCHRRPVKDGQAGAVRVDAGRACQPAGMAGAAGRHASRLRVPEPGRSCRPPQHAAVRQACRRVGGRGWLAQGRSTVRIPSAAPRRRSSTKRRATCVRCRSCWVTRRSRTPCAIWVWTSKTRSPSLKALKSDQDGSLQLRGAGRVRAQCRSSAGTKASPVSRR